MSLKLNSFLYDILYFFPHEVIHLVLSFELGATPPLGASSQASSEDSCHSSQSMFPLTMMNTMTMNTKLLLHRATILSVCFIAPDDLLVLGNAPLEESEESEEGEESEDNVALFLRRLHFTNPKKWLEIDFLLLGCIRQKVTLVDT